MNIKELDWLGVIFGILPLLGTLSFRTRVMGERGRKASAVFNTILGVYLLRIAFLRLATGGGATTVYDPDSSILTQFLGSSIVFCIMSIALFAAYIYRNREENFDIERSQAIREQLLKLNITDKDLVSKDKTYKIIIKKLDSDGHVEDEFVHNVEPQETDTKRWPPPRKRY